MFGRKPPAWNADTDFMGLVPDRAVQDDGAAPDGTIVLLVPRFRDPILGRWLQPRLPQHKRFIRVPLEARGSHLWRAMDGRRSIGELCRSYAAAFPEDSDDLHRRVGIYLYHLAQNRFISLR